MDDVEDGIDPLGKSCPASQEAAAWAGPVCGSEPGVVAPAFPEGISVAAVSAMASAADATMRLTVIRFPSE